MSWKPFLRQGVNLLENVQRRYTKRIWGMRKRPYVGCLSCFSALSLERSLELADLYYAYKINHGFEGLSLDEAGISLQKGVTRSFGLRF